MSRKRVVVPARQSIKAGGIETLESILGLLQSLKIRALVQLSVKEKEAVSVPFQETRFTGGFHSPSRPKLPGNSLYSTVIVYYTQIFKVYIALYHRKKDLIKNNKNCKKPFSIAIIMQKFSFQLLLFIVKFKIHIIGIIYWHLSGQFYCALANSVSKISNSANSLTVHACGNAV